MRLLAALLLALAAVAMPAWAAEPMVLVFDQAQTLRLAVPARRVIVGNPNIADVTVETPTLLTLFGRAVGETTLIVLDGEDHEVLTRSLVVTGETARHVTVHVPDATASREYSCVANRCLKTASPDATSAAAIPAAAATSGTETPAH